MTCTLASADTIRGVVVDRTGATIVGAKVEARTSKSHKSLETTGDGSFAIDIDNAAPAKVSAGEWESG